MSFVDSVMALAEKILPVVSGATGPYVSAALAAAEAIKSLVTDVKSTAGEEDQAKLDAMLTELEARVNAHADSTIDRLDG